MNGSKRVVLVLSKYAPYNIIEFIDRSSGFPPKESLPPWGL
jgi:hypothetical protein